MIGLWLKTGPMKNRNDFLKAYIKEFLYLKKFPKYLCEYQHYRPRSKQCGDSFQMISFGWLWAKCGPISGKIEAIMLEKEMDKVYQIVAKENNWLD